MRMSRLNKTINENSRGQALLVVLLSLAVVLTIVLFIVSRSITDITVSTREEESLRAFSAAEAGIEQALIVGTGINGQDINVGDAQFNADVSSYSEGVNQYMYPFSLYSGETATFWFVNHDANGNLTCDGVSSTDDCFQGSGVNVCWGNEGTSAMPAVEVSVYYTATPGDFTTLQIGRAAFDSDSSRNNGFDLANSNGCTFADGQKTAYVKRVNFTDLGISQNPGAGLGYENVVQFMKVKMLYNGIAPTGEKQIVGLGAAYTGEVFPSQGIRVNSLGSYADSNRRIEVFQLHAETPEIFNNAVYVSSGGISK